MTKIIVQFLLVIVSGLPHLMNCYNIKGELVFEAFSGGESTAYTLYMGDGVSQHNSTDKQHFKHPLVNMWGKEISVQTVTIAIMKDSNVGAYVVFNGEGTSKSSWLQQKRIIKSSYTDIRTSRANYFSVEGIKLSGVLGRRSFYMNKKFNHCPGDYGWIQMKTGFGTCSWETTKKENTLVSYSSGTAAGRWKDNLIADSLRIYITYVVNLSLTTTPSVLTELPFSVATLPSVTSATASRDTTETQKTTGTTLDVEESTVPELLFTSASSSPENLIVSSAKIWSSTDVESTAKSPQAILDVRCKPCCVNEGNFTEKILTMTEMTEMVKMLKLQLKVNKTTLSQYIRRRTSATDNRTSAVAVGSVLGGSTAALVFSIIVLPDVFAFGRFMWTKFKSRS